MNPHLNAVHQRVPARTSSPCVNRGWTPKPGLGVPPVLLFSPTWEGHSRHLLRPRGSIWFLCFNSYGCGSQNWYQNGPLVSGNMDQNPRFAPPMVHFERATAICWFIPSLLRNHWGHRILSKRKTCTFGGLSPNRFGSAKRLPFQSNMD